MLHRSLVIAPILLSAVGLGCGSTGGRRAAAGAGGGESSATGSANTTSSGATGGAGGSGGSTSTGVLTTSTSVGTSTGSNGSTTSTGTTTTSSGGGSASTSTTGTATTGTSTSSSSGTPCPDHCSADLHDIIDCNDNVVMACGPTQGCSSGVCIDACLASAQTQSSVGCEYYAVDPDIISEVSGACFAAFIENTWNSPVTLGIDRGGTSYDPSTFAYLPVGSGENLTYMPLTSGQIPAGQVAIVFLAGSPTVSVGACPAGVNVAVPSDASVAGTGIGSAFHITTNAPVAAYDIFPYGGGSAAATSATLLLPTATWDTNYVAIDAYAPSQLAASAGAEPFIDIVASFDNTNVTITPVAAIAGGTNVMGSPAGTAITYPLNAGQVLQIAQTDELTGSIIQSDKPVGHWGGASCMNIPVDVAACDSAHQQIPPVRALGWQYAAVRYRNRFDPPAADETPPWRMVGAIDSTTLTYDPAPPTGAPLTLDAGQVVEFASAGNFSVTSDATHPFYMAAYMTGCAELDPDLSDCRGDPEFVNLIPPQQYLKSYSFFTDPTYPETNLVLVRSAGTSGFQDVTLDCAGTITGWQPIGSAGTLEYARIDLVRYNFAGQNGCDNGAHTITSTAPFGLTVWGWGSAATGGTYGCVGSGCGGFYSQAVSYAYPAGASIQPINSVVAR